MSLDPGFISESDRLVLEFQIWVDLKIPMNDFAGLIFDSDQMSAVSAGRNVREVNVEIRSLKFEFNFLLNLPSHFCFILLGN